MKELTLVIQNETGLHARPAKALVKLAKGFESSISVRYGEQEVNAKSMIGILKLGVRKAESITVLIDGADEDVAAAEIETAVSTGLGEPLHHAAPAKTNEPTSQPTNERTNQPTNELHGVSASPGIAVGELFQLRREHVVVQREFQGLEAEQTALNAAMAAVETEIQQMKQNAAQTLSEEEAAIFDAHLEILHDMELKTAVHEQLQAKQPASMAWQHGVDTIANVLSQLDDETLAARATDVRDVGRQVQAHLSGQNGTTFPKRPFILTTDDLTPSETVSLDRDLVLGFATSAGGPTAHSAILARALKLPAVVGLGEALLKLDDGEQVILDGQTGVVKLKPTEEAIAAANAEAARLQEQQAAQEAKAGEAAVTQDGHQIEVVSNIGSAAEAAQAYALGAEGVGLLRTEFLFLGQEEPPSEESQTAVYTEIVKAMPNLPVIIRTLDIGGDKPVPYITVPEEANPFLGERGIRLCLNRPELFKTQLRAIVRASAHGKILIMFPMVSDVSEIKQARQLVESVVAELNAKPISIGMMIEVPAAALMADQFAPYLDFFSIGTNDLTQYTMAIDRQHPSLAKLSDGLHPAVLRLIGKTVQAAEAAGIWVGVCGELAADPQAVPILVGLGVKELSVNMNAIAAVKAAVRELTKPDAQALAQRALACATAGAVRQLQ